MQPKSGSQWSCSTSCNCSSVRLPTGGGTLVRFDFHEIGGPGWIRTINLPSQNRALFYLSYGAIKLVPTGGEAGRLRGRWNGRSSFYIRPTHAVLLVPRIGMVAAKVVPGWNRTNFLQLMRLTSDRCSSPGLKTILRPALPRHGPHYECGALLTSATEECLARKRLRKKRGADSA